MSPRQPGLPLLYSCHSVHRAYAQYSVHSLIPQAEGIAFSGPPPACSLLLIHVDKLYYRNGSPEEVEGRMTLLHQGRKKSSNCGVILYPVTQEHTSGSRAKRIQI